MGWDVHGPPLVYIDTFSEAVHEERPGFHGRRSDFHLGQVEIALEQLHTFEEDYSSEDGRKCALEAGGLSCLRN